MSQMVITDVDDCLILTTESLKAHGVSKKTFYFDMTVYEQHKHRIFYSATITPWGREFMMMVKARKIRNYMVITAARNRADILHSIFGIDKRFEKEDMSNKDKVLYLNSIREPFIYVDDKNDIINKIDNPCMVQTFLYPSFHKSFAN